MRQLLLFLSLVVPLGAFAQDNGGAPAGTCHSNAACSVSSLTATGAVSGSNLSGTNTGDVTLGAVGSTPGANGASLSGQVLTLQPADATNPGVVTTGTQTFAGAKTLGATTVASLTSSGAVSGTTGTFSGLISSSVASGAHAVEIPSGSIHCMNGSTCSVYLQEDATANLRLGAGGSGGSKSVFVLAKQMSTPALDLSDQGTVLSLTTCGSTTEGNIRRDATGGTGGLATKLCACALESDGTTYRWHNLSHWDDATGTTSACPNGIANGNAVEFAYSAWDSITAVGTTGAISQMGALTNAATLVDCNYTVVAAAVGTGTETIELCNGTGITSGNCTGTKYATLSLTSSNGQGTVVACTINTSALAAGAVPTWIITASTIATTDATGNITAHLKE